MIDKRVYGLTALAAVYFVSTFTWLAWQKLIDYRIDDGLAFSRDVRNGTFEHSLMAHRCFSAVYETCFYKLPGEPRDNDDECVPPISNRCRCDHVAQAFCYTTFPVACGTEDHTGKLQFDTCDRVFPHGFKHFKELLRGY